MAPRPPKTRSRFAAGKIPRRCHDGELPDQSVRIFRSGPLWDKSDCPLTAGNHSHCALLAHLLAHIAHSNASRRHKTHAN
uniref:Uncharacterized protein n=1 Tax=mine drainage metagenome TaxID=410659 RepID=E6PLX2_9ZZZZ